MATMVFKVFTLTLKTISKPLASRFEQYVMGHPVLRSKVINMAQWLHSMEVSISRGAEGKEGRVFVGSMSEEKAVQLASKFASESFVYGTALLLLILEMQRKDKEDREKKRKQNEEKEYNAMLHRRHEDAELQLEKLLKRMDERIQSIEEHLDARSSSQRKWNFFW
jgi:hypothetical protein